MKTIFSLILFSICIAPANAQEAVALYQAEIIVFKQIEADAAIDKIKDVIRPKTKLHQGRAALDLFAADPDGDIRAIPTNQLQLIAEAQRIKQDSQYELLYHGAWQQPPHHHAQAPYINVLGEPQNGLLKGIAWMSYERFFKLLLDFQYDPDFDKAPEVMDIPQASSLSIHLERTLAEKKLFYLDHPVIGVIAYINPITEN